MAATARPIHPKQLSHWQVNGNEPIFERGTVRLAVFKKSFPSDAKVMVRDKKTGELSPFLLRSGRPLLISETLPERADLCLDEDGVLVDQNEFQQRYHLYLSSFLTPAGFVVEDEPVPNVVKYINAKPDEWSESKGMVEIDYDPKFEEFKPRVMFDGEREIPVEEYERIQAEKQAKEDRMERLLLALGERLVTDEPVNGTPYEEIDSAPEGKEQAPCGEYITEGYIKQHQRFCKNEACMGGAPEAA